MIYQDVKNTNERGPGHSINTYLQWFRHLCLMSCLMYNVRQKKIWIKQEFYKFYKFSQKLDTIQDTNINELLNYCLQYQKEKVKKNTHVQRKNIGYSWSGYGSFFPLALSTIKSPTSEAISESEHCINLINWSFFVTHWIVGKCHEP